MPFVSYAQNGEDVLLWRALRDVGTGFYIDVGATGPDHCSVTLAFYERGWHGINIAPNRASMTALQAARPRDANLEMTIETKTDSLTFSAHGFQPKERQVQARTLAEICETWVTGEIHFLKIDVEGLQSQVIAGGDFDRFRPWIIVVEAAAANSFARREWETVLTAANYSFAHFDGLNCFYIATEQRDRLVLLASSPVNASDDYIAVCHIRQAQAAANSGVHIPGLVSAAALEEAERRAAAGEQRAVEAERKARDAELRILAQETEFQMLRAEEAQPIALRSANSGVCDQPEDDDFVTRPGAQRIFLDATLILRHGFLSAVGIVRVEHYVAEYLARDPTIALDFVAYDMNCGSYRAVIAEEKEFLRQILFHRYKDTIGDLATTAVGETGPGNEAGSVTAAAKKGIEAAWPAMGVLAGRNRRIPSSRRWLWVADRIRLVARLRPAEFRELQNAFVLRRLPVRPDQSASRRASVRLLRRMFLAGGRVGHRSLLVAAQMRRRLAGPIRRLIAPDPVTGTPVPLVGLSTIAYDYTPFRPGDILLSMANTWDYMDYRYLAALGRDMGVRLICVIYDVVGMELPFVTPAPAHLYHRHWVEIGHASERLIAISRFSAESYNRYVAAPNSIDVPVDYALLPNFLQERAAEIGETAVTELTGRNFVIYCSTIEVRKNHILLLNLWDELRQQVPVEKLPVLVFVGKWGWSAETVQLLADRNWRLRSHLLIMNDTSDAQLIWLYRHARFSVFPSLTEGFGLAASESLSFGTPVVISNCPALLEATERLMPAFHPHDFVGWRHELERLILDDDYLETLRQKATRFRGPAYDTFAAAIRDAALAPSPSVEVQPVTEGDGS